MLKRLPKQDDLCTGMDGGKAAHTGRDQQSFLGKPSSHNINGDHAYGSQVQVWSAVEHENSISAAKAKLLGLKVLQSRSDQCPHRGQADSGGHILEGCGVPAFKAMYIACHDQALCRLLKSIAKGDHGGYYTIADIGRAELIEDMHMGVNVKSIPPWLLPDLCLKRAEIDPADRNRLGPDVDILLVRDDTVGVHEI